MGRGYKWDGPEGDRNYELAGGLRYRFTILDATQVLTSGGVAPQFGLRHWRRRWYTLPALHPKSEALYHLFNPVVHLVDHLYNWLRYDDPNTERP